MARKSTRLYVGVKNGTYRIFRSAAVPTEVTHPEFHAAIGPFRTKAGAEYMCNNTRCETVAQAERMSRRAEVRNDQGAR